MDEKNHPQEVIWYDMSLFAEFVLPWQQYSDRQVFQNCDLFSFFFCLKISNAYVIALTLLDHFSFSFWLEYF